MQKLFNIGSKKMQIIFDTGLEFIVQKNNFVTGVSEIRTNLTWLWFKKEVKSDSKIIISIFNLHLLHTLRYSVFQGFSKAKSANGGSILSSSQFLILPQLPQKIKLASKVVKVDSKIIISLPKI